MNESALTIGILECGSNLDQWMDSHGDFADWFKPFLLKAANRTVAFKVFHAHKGNLPCSTDEADVWLVTGSPISVYEEPAWQLQLVDFLVRSIPSKPIIGVCYGHQLLHHMLGGKVEKMPDWGIGVHSYDVINHPSWLSSSAQTKQFSLLTSHQDQVTHLATDTRLLGTSAFCSNAITQIGSNILTIQAHPELTKALARVVYEFRREDQGEELTEQALMSTHETTNDDIFCEWIYNFIDQVRAGDCKEEPSTSAPVASTIPAASIPMRAGKPEN